MTKSELIEIVAQEAKLTKGRAELVINAIFESMIEALQRGDGIEIRGFGSFKVRQYGAYQGRDPRTGETKAVAPKRLPRFKPGKDMRERVNGKAPTDEPARKPRAEGNTVANESTAPGPARLTKSEVAEDVI